MLPSFESSGYPLWWANAKQVNVFTVKENFQNVPIIHVNFLPHGLELRRPDEPLHVFTPWGSVIAINEDDPPEPPPPPEVQPEIPPV